MTGEASATFLAEAYTAAEAALQHLTRLTKLCIVDSTTSWVAALPLLPTLQVHCSWVLESWSGQCITRPVNTIRCGSTLDM
jgi:predicted short-subunit dehydrogenase-like oxidoreductase (DUF2520 family)